MRCFAGLGCGIEKAVHEEGAHKMIDDSLDLFLSPALQRLKNKLGNPGPNFFNLFGGILANMCDVL